MTRHDDGTEQGKFDGPPIAGSVSLAKSNLQAAAVLLSISENSMRRRWSRPICESLPGLRNTSVWGWSRGGTEVS